MSDPFVAEIRMMAFNFAPTGWARCDGQLMPISQNTALFALLGTTYGGDGRSTFALPDLQGSVAMHQGQGNGLSQRFLGEKAGAESITLLQSELPAHNHTLSVSSAVGTTNVAANNQLGRGQSGNPVSGVTQAKVYSAAPPNTSLDPRALALAGGDLPHNNMMPYTTVNFCIAMQGVFPPRP